MANVSPARASQKNQSAKICKRVGKKVVNKVYPAVFGPVKDTVAAHFNGKKMSAASPAIQNAGKWCCYMLHMKGVLPQMPESMPGSPLSDDVLEEDAFDCVMQKDFSVSDHQFMYLLRLFVCIKHHAGGSTRQHGFGKYVLSWSPKVIQDVADCVYTAITFMPNLDENLLAEADEYIKNHFGGSARLSGNAVASPSEPVFGFSEDSMNGIVVDFEVPNIQAEIEVPNMTAETEVQSELEPASPSQYVENMNENGKRGRDDDEELEHSVKRCPSSGVNISDYLDFSYLNNDHIIYRDFGSDLIQIDIASY